ncbi:sensor histidine kinase [Nonomuraea endophytica]|uniref:Signal transduction histidine kinase n=1 Tax=Nonomuraea endophytica TaxID=714136 RepID=A0A7W8EIG8_9ACTN|nr:histidine kinase [Nonomuraea endophytica]MBB5082015.1 signal transduction histidine kinase [Nonomuraea endophytica]
MAKRAWILVIAALASFASIYVAAGSWLAVVVCVAQMAFVRWRHWPILAVVVLSSYAAVLGFGTSVGILGFAGGALLLTRLRPLAVLVVGSAAVLGNADGAISAMLISLVVYGLTTLIRQVEEITATRLALAMSAAAEERLRIAAELNQGLGRALATIAAGAHAGDPQAETARASLAEARAAAAGYRAMSLAPEITTARAMLSSAGIAAEVRVGHEEPLGPAGALLAAVLREAVTDVLRQAAASLCVIETAWANGRVSLRVTSDGARTADDAFLDDLPARVEEAGGRLVTRLTDEGRLSVEATLPDLGRPRADNDSYRLSMVLAGAVVLGFVAKGLMQTPAHLLAPAAALLAAIVALQLTSVKGRHMGRLAVLTALTYLPLPLLGRSWLGVLGFLAGPVLLSFSWRVAVPLAGLVAASAGVAGHLLGLPVPAQVNYTLSTLVTAMVLYGLIKLAQIIKESRDSRDALARAAVVEERLRAARDLHDLLGHSLAAILIKCELARRLGNPESELRDIAELAERAQADLRSVSGDHLDLALPAEAGNARAVLTAAGIEVAVELSHPPLPAAAETVLSTVLREAVTNVLRHSTARHCTVTTTTDGHQVRLRVRNDGVNDGPIRRGSAGIGNLTTRLAALGGTLSTTREDGWFTLEAALPSDPAGLARDADGVGAVAGVELGHDRRQVVADGARGQV